MLVTPWATKFQRMRPLIADLVAEGLDVHVLTDASFADAVRRAGGTFADLYGSRPVDDTSLPQPSRHVVHAAVHGPEVAAELGVRRPCLIVHDSFAVIGRVVAEILELPRATMVAGHAPDPAVLVARQLRGGPYAPSTACRRAVETLRDRYGWEDASPLSYLTSRSEILNLFGEPAEWLTAGERAALGNVEFYGSLPPLAEIADLTADPRPIGVLASLGTQAWHYWPEVVEAALRCVRDVVAAADDMRGLISLGGATGIEVPAAENVKVVPYTQQWRALAGADVFVTHHGVYSTHEAVITEVPMLAYPLFSDQPTLAARAAELGVSVPLADEPRAALDPDRLRAALEQVAERRDTVGEALARARSWELRTLQNRAAVAARLAALGT
jgi:UDP:flavonoid glycosyltransferase YjiC (YdhE family)